MKKIYFTIIVLLATIVANAQTITVYEYDDNVSLSNTPAYTSSKKVKVVFADKQEHKYVDLGLPSGTLWATCNIGANVPEDYGLFFAWGETVGNNETDISNLHLFDYNLGNFKKTSFSWVTYKYAIPYEYITKYCTDSSVGRLDNKKMIEPSDDAAYVRWGVDWHIPSTGDFHELCNTDNCSWTWFDKGNTEFNGVAGYKIQSKITGYTDQFIFLPATGMKQETGSVDTGRVGHYWASNLYDSKKAYSLIIAYNNIDCRQDWQRYLGISIRPVRSSK